MGARSLSIIDNGTGMEQTVIEDHLLKVGSSRYQDPKFKKENPNFSPISRFGIGVLSAFMVSDEIEITTCSPTDAEARRISLRSVHGRYLIRLLDKKTSPEAKELFPHGTKFTLRIRPSARLNDILGLVKQWILLPACQVTVEIDRGTPVPVGFSSPKEALEDYINSKGLQSLSAQGKPTVKVIERSINGMTLAYAVRWSEHFKDWSILSVDRTAPGTYTIPSTCVEGITIDNSTPGFRQRNILAIANATGKTAPKTNVARSSLERTPELEATVGSIFDIYLGHMRDEMRRLHSEEGYSLTWAVTNAISLAYPITSQIQFSLFPEMLEKKIREIQMFLIEKNRGRETASFSQLKEAKAFWTSDSALIRSSEHLVKETSGNASVGAVLEALNDKKAKLPTGLYLSNFDTPTISYIIEEQFEPTEFVLQPASRRIDVKWEAVGEKARWLHLRHFYANLERHPSLRNQRLKQTIEGILQANRGMSLGYHLRRLSIPVYDITSTGTQGYVGLGVTGRVFLCPGTPLAQFLFNKAGEISTDDNEGNFFVFAATALLLILHGNKQDSQARLSTLLKRFSYDLGFDYSVLQTEMSPIIEATPLQFFDSFAWSLRENAIQYEHTGHVEQDGLWFVADDGV